VESFNILSAKLTTLYAAFSHGNLAVETNTKNCFNYSSTARTP